jgi:Zn-finger nucleic acid-binding protein
MNCPRCGAPMNFIQERMYFQCPYCTTIHIPEVDDQGVQVHEIPGKVDCPLCGERLVQGALEKYAPLLVCPKCRGQLYSQGIFGRAVRQLRATARTPAVDPAMLNPDELHRTVNCPSCGKPMSTHPYGGPGNVVVDMCAVCGLVWLDYREIRRILDAPGRDRAIT